MGQAPDKDNAGTETAQACGKKEKKEIKTAKEVPKKLTGKFSMPVPRIHYIFQKYSSRNASKNKETTIGNLQN